MLALVEGWVDAVTADATVRRLPKSDAIAETVRRRRASGGPAESAFATLVGLELRPRRLREAAAMWRAVTDAVGVEAATRCGRTPTSCPPTADIDDPSASSPDSPSTEPTTDDVDQALEELLDDDSGDRPASPERDPTGRGSPQPVRGLRSGRRSRHETAVWRECTRAVGSRAMLLAWCCASPRSSPSSGGRPSSLQFGVDPVRQVLDDGRRSARSDCSPR